MADKQDNIEFLSSLIEATHQEGEQHHNCMGFGGQVCNILESILIKASVIEAEKNAKRIREKCSTGPR